MTLTAQRRVIAVSSMVTFGLGVIARTEQGDVFDTNAARFYIGTGLAFTIVSVFTDLGMEIGAGFAILIMLGALFTEGQDVFNFLNKRSAKKPPVKRKPTTAGATGTTGKGGANPPAGSHPKQPPNPHAFPNAGPNRQLP